MRIALAACCLAPACYPVSLEAFMSTNSCTIN